ncbi:hypothetical protein [Microbacterium sp.]|uniref:hypothetical protein n=1 Tax=Microbacterium sp. TaxID=51671 RepID=UPI0027371C5E|nr:hypothetical protein [Microbacterium sp.]MDP3950542.1 hypothetical protein [Microbacterium sp.]
MPEEARRARRGPKPNPNRGTPTGYRIADRTRFELQIAAAFVGARSLQETMDIAVAEFLERQYQVDGFKRAVAAAEANQRARSGIPTVGSTEE